MQMNPLVSVIIPTYNRSKLLKKTLESVYNQTYTNFEVLVIDDGSPNDDAMLICQAFEKMTYIKIDNFGAPARPKNIGIQKAKGKYLAFVDDDDIWLPQKLERQIDVLEQNPDFGLVHCCCEVIDINDIRQDRIMGRPGAPDVKHGDVKLRMIGNWTIMMPTPLIRKEIVDKVGFFNEEIMPPAGEDVEYWVRCSFFTNFYYIDEPLVWYRVHSQNMTNREASAYINLPIHLKNVLTDFKSKKIINRNQYKKLLQNLCRMQIKMIEKNWFSSLRNLFILNPNWMFQWNNLKLLTYILIKSIKKQSR